MDAKKELVQDVQALVQDDLKSQRAIQELSDAKEEAELSRKERSGIVKMRERWSLFILICILFIVLMDFVIIFLLGFRVIRFEGAWTVPALVADSLIKVIGLAMIVVKFLFNKDSLSR